MVQRAAPLLSDCQPGGGQKIVETLRLRRQHSGETQRRQADGCFGGLRRFGRITRTNFYRWNLKLSWLLRIDEVKSADSRVGDAILLRVGVLWPVVGEANDGAIQFEGRIVQTAGEIVRDENFHLQPQRLA